jgi:hypothetical protein
MHIWWHIEGGNKESLFMDFCVLDKCAVIGSIFFSFLYIEFLFGEMCLEMKEAKGNC